jgi:hypothetical protein
MILMAAIAIGSNHISIGINDGLNGGLLLIDSTRPCWAINLNKALNSSAKGLL